ncbi:hypothetical protein BGZ97_010236, partial [Linnemannia gamsii]
WISTLSVSARVKVNSKKRLSVLWQHCNCSWHRQHRPQRSSRQFRNSSRQGHRSWLQTQHLKT